MDNQLFQIIKQWNHISGVIKEASNELEYNLLIKYWKELLDLIGDDETHELVGLLEIISYFIEKYDNKNILNSKVRGIEVLKFLIQSHNLRQKDLAELGSQGVVSELLNGKRQLNLRQIKCLAKRFKITPASFL